MLLCLTACPSGNSDNAAISSSLTTSEDKSESELKSESEVSSKPETSSSPKKPSSSVPSSNHKHQYEKTQLTASCGQEGGTLYSCACGESYKENVVAPSYKHDFKEQSITLSEDTFTVYVCEECGTQALYVTEWWKYKAQFDDLRWYVTGKITPSQDGKSHIESDYEIVVCGKGAIEDYSEDAKTAPWRRFLGSKLKSITVTGGVTSIGQNAFSYKSRNKMNVGFYIGGCVKTIKSGAIKLNIYDIVLENGVETIERSAITGVQNLYLPESVKTCADLGLKSSTRYYYEGDLDSLLKIQVENPQYALRPLHSLKERCDWYSQNAQDSEGFCTVILNSSKIGKGKALFDGKNTKTDTQSLKEYVK